MSIGETLATAREKAGLTVTQVSEATRIRETVIRAIERDDFAVCGGHFYARGHIRSIARTIGVDPEPLVQEYDDGHGGAPQTIRASEVFEPETPVKIAGRRRPNWSAAMAAALAVLIIYAAFQLISGGADQSGQVAGGSAPSPPPQAAVTASPSSSAAPPDGEGSSDTVARAPEDQVVVVLEAEESCWVSVRNADGDRLYEGLVREGKTKTWKDDERLRLVIGNAGGASLTVNNRDLGIPGEEGEVVRVSFGPGDPERG